MNEEIKMKFLYFIILYTSLNIIKNIPIDLNDIDNTTTSVLSFTAEGRQINDIKDGIKELMKDNELQTMRKNLSNNQKKHYFEQSIKNNPRIQLNKNILDLAENIQILLENYLDENETLTNIINIMNKLEKEIASKESDEKKLVSFITKNNINKDESGENNLTLYIINSIITLNQLLSYKDNIYQTKNSNNEYVFLQLSTIHDALIELLNQHQIFA